MTRTNKCNKEPMSLNNVQGSHPPVISSSTLPGVWQELAAADRPTCVPPPPTPGRDKWTAFSQDVGTSTRRGLFSDWSTAQSTSPYTPVIVSMWCLVCKQPTLSTYLLTYIHIAQSPNLLKSSYKMVLLQKPKVPESNHCKNFTLTTAPLSGTRD